MVDDSIKISRGRNKIGGVFGGGLAQYWPGTQNVGTDHDIAWGVCNILGLDHLLG
jgi:hypothetical protein